MKQVCVEVGVAKELQLPLPAPTLYLKKKNNTTTEHLLLASNRDLTT